MIPTLFILSYIWIICLIQRYVDDIFFTSNQSLDIIKKMLDEVNSSHPNIKLVRQLGTTASFLNISYHSNLIIHGMFLIILLIELYCAPCVTHLHFQHLMKNGAHRGVARGEVFGHHTWTKNSWTGYRAEKLFAKVKTFLIGRHLP